MTTWLLLPVKSFASGKGRLRGVLPDTDRAALSQYFLQRLLTVATRFPGLARTAVVSDGDDALQCTARAGALALRQSSRPGLQAAATEGVDRLAERGARRVILLACDTPLVNEDDLRELASLARGKRMVAICPDRHGSGTNALVFPARARLPFQFGEESAKRHAVASIAAGLVAVMHRNPRIAQDIDTPEDLATWLAPNGRGDGLMNAQLETVRRLTGIQPRVTSPC